MRIVTFMLVACAALAASLAPAATGAADLACAQPYAYAGKVGWRSAAGVAATLTALDGRAISSGHVAAWVGVGGRGLGAGGADAWLQVGLSAFPGTRGQLYYEVTLPNAKPRYVALEGDVAPGSARRVAVVAEGREAWSVWVGGKRRAGPFRLPGSAAWRPVATAEAWGGGEAACNRLRYRFASVSTRTRTGRWTPLGDAAVLSSRGYAIDRTRGNAFVASATF